MSRPLRIVAIGIAIAAALLAHGRLALAQVAEFNTTHTIYYEAPFKSHMFVYSPAADLKVTPIDALDVRAGWEADVVSGASVAVKAGPAYAATHPNADIVTAASVHDFRNVAHGGFTVRHDAVALDADYSYSTEHDYKSHTVSVGARTDLFEHNTQLAISYARNFDFVCNRTQSPTALPSQYTALENSDGCFTGGATPSRLTDQIAIDGFQASWSQSLTPTFAMQFVYTGQITNGFQSDPYRSVIIGENLKAQEHVPDNRTRNALAVRGNLFLKPLKAAVRIGIRAYDDTWGIESGTADAEFEKYFGERFRAVARARFYKQSGALFWSDDYSGGNAPLGPKGQYFTGDRELSPFESILLGLGATYAVTPTKGRILGLMSTFKLQANGDVIQFIYNDYTLAGSAVSGSEALMASLSMTLVF